jgi:molecular chaperone DnaJ
MKDYYKILGVDKKSTQDDIKKAYRKLSKKYHPDVNGGDDVKFKEIVEAYETLGDDKKRNQYDNPNPFSGKGGNPFSDFMNHFNNQHRRQSRPQKIVNVDVSPKESYIGGYKEITFKNKHKCNLCAGTGGKKNICQRCEGVGSLRQKVGTGFMTQIIDTQCPQCAGSGKIIIEPCTSCFGTGGKEKFETIKINIPKSANSGESLRVTGKGDYHNNFGYGDVVFKIRVVPQDGFEKINNDLVYIKNVNYKDVFLISDINIPHPDGDLNIKLPKKFETNKPLRVKGKGYLTGNHIGDFYIKLNIIYEEMSVEEKEKLKDIF